jgi:hypothetical protein
MLYADRLHREYVAASSAQHVAGHPVSALASWVARWVAGKRERRLVHHNLLILKEFLAMHPQYDIVLL